MNTLTPKDISFRDFLTFCFKRKYQIFLFFIIIFCTIIGISFSQIPLYRATGQILVKIGSRDAYSLNGSSRVESGWGVLDKQLNTEAVFLKSRFLAEKVINTLGPEVIYPWLESKGTNLEENNKPEENRSFFKEIFKIQPIKKIKSIIFRNSTAKDLNGEIPQISAFQVAVASLQKNLTIKGVQNSNIFEIAFWHMDPETAATVINTFMDTYLDERLKFQKNVEASTFFNDQSLELQDRLVEAEKDLEEYKNEHNISDLEQQRGLFLQQISNLDTELKDTSSKIIETESRIALITKQLSRTPETNPEVIGQTDQNQFLMSQLEAKLVDLQIEEKELLSKYTPHSRTVENVRERIEIVEIKIKEQQSKLVQRSSASKNTTYQRLQEELFGDQRDLKALYAKKEVLSRQLTGLERDIESLNNLETKLNGLQQSVDLYRGNYKLYLAKLEASRIENVLDIEKINDVVSIDRATPPLKPISPRYKLNLILATLLGCSGALLIAIISDYLDDNLETPEDVEKNLQLTVLTSIPDTASRKRLDHRKIGTIQSDIGIRNL